MSWWVNDQWNWGIQGDAKLSLEASNSLEAILILAKKF